MLAFHRAYFHRMNGPTRPGSERSDAFGPSRGVHPGTPGVRGLSTGNMGACLPPDPGRCRAEIGMFRKGSGLPGQFGLVEFPAGCHWRLVRQCDMGRVLLRRNAMAMAFLQSGDVRFPAPWLLFIFLSFFFANDAWAVLWSPAVFVYTGKKCNCPQMAAKSWDLGVVCWGAIAVRPVGSLA